MLPAGVIYTKYAGPCKTCGTRVPAQGPNQGYAVKEAGQWNRYCRQCVPVKIVHTPATTERNLYADGRLVMPFERHNLDLIRSIPGAFFDRNTSPPAWRVSLDEGNRARLLEICEKLKVEVDPSLAIKLTENAKAAEIAGLYPFQVDGVDFLTKTNQALLADEMGLGKTVQTLKALQSTDAALAIVPSGVRFNWLDEAKKWRPDLKVTVLQGRDSFRWPEIGELVITGYDILPKWAEPQDPWEFTCTNSKCAHYGKGQNAPGRCQCGANYGKPQKWHQVCVPPTQAEADFAKKHVVVIGDEVQRIKNWKTQRSRRVKGLCMLARKVIGLTGTPLENRPEDLFGLLECLGMSKAVFGKYDWIKFVEVMNGQKGRFGGYTWGKPKPILPELLRRVMLRRRRAEVLPDLPTKQYTTIKVDVKGRLKDELDILWEEYEETLTGKKELPPFEEFSRIRARLAESRIEAAEELVEEHEDAEIPLLVFSAHLAPLDRIGSRPGWAKITGDTPSEKRQEIVRAFQAGSLKGVAISIRAGGVGLTLTRAWKAIFIDLDWVPGANSQAEDRICRLGQTATHCEIVRMVSDHPLDIHVLDLLAIKIALIQAAVEDSIVPYIAEHRADETDAEYDERMMSLGELRQINQELAIANRHEIPEPWPAITIDPDIPF